MLVLKTRTKHKLNPVLLAHGTSTDLSTTKCIPQYSLQKQGHPVKYFMFLKFNNVHEREGLFKIS